MALVNTCARECDLERHRSATLPGLAHTCMRRGQPTGKPLSHERTRTHGDNPKQVAGLEMPATLRLVIRIERYATPRRGLRRLRVRRARRCVGTAVGSSERKPRARRFALQLEGGDEKKGWWWCAVLLVARPGPRPRAPPSGCTCVSRPDRSGACAFPPLPTD